MRLEMGLSIIGTECTHLIRNMQHHFPIFLKPELISDHPPSRVGLWVYGLLGCILFSALISELISDV